MPATLEERGTAHGLDYEVVATHMGHRCGYVRIPAEHPLFGLDYSHTAPDVSMEDLEGERFGKRGVVSLIRSGGPEARDVALDLLFDVHGSLTFSGARRSKADWWLGFDCAHLGDGRDPELMSAQMRRVYGYLGRGIDDGPARSLEYVREECKSLAEQIVQRYPLGEEAR